MRAGALSQSDPLHGEAVEGKAVEGKAVEGDRARGHLELVRQSATTAATLAHQRTLPVVDGLASLVPSGLIQRGSTLSMHGVGATSFALALLGEAVRDGSFLAVIAPASFGLAACLDFDIPLRRVVQFVLPRSGPDVQWGQSVAAIVEGFDLVMLVEGQQIRASYTRQLVARNRERGSVLARVGGSAWPDAADLRFDLGTPEWAGLGQGHGHLRARQVSVQVAGRRYHGASRAQTILLPAVGGGVDGTERSVRQERSVNEDRFAGSDIDVLLDVIDASGQTHSGSARSGQTHSGSARSGQTHSGSAHSGQTHSGSATA